MLPRAFIALLGVAAMWPLAVRAQQPPMPVVAFLAVGSPDALRARVVAFRKGLSETGYVEDRNVAVEYHWLGGNYERLPAVLDDVVRRGVAVIAVPGGTPVSLAAKAATATIPIVFGVAENPVLLGLVKSLAHPGGNATGINFFAIETDAKRLGLMRELLPRAARLAVLVNPTNVRYTEATSKSLQESAHALGVEIVFFNATTPAEIDSAFEAIVRERADALFIAAEAFFGSRRVQLAALATRERIPASFSSRELVEAGLLMSYGTNLADMARQVGVYTGAILKGASRTTSRSSNRPNSSWLSISRPPKPLASNPAPPARPRRRGDRVRRRSQSEDRQGPRPLFAVVRGVNSSFDAAGSAAAWLVKQKFGALSQYSGVVLLYCTGRSRRCWRSDPDCRRSQSAGRTLMTAPRERAARIQNNSGGVQDAAVRVQSYWRMGRDQRRERFG